MSRREYREQRSARSSLIPARAQLPVELRRVGTMVGEPKNRGLAVLPGGVPLATTPGSVVSPALLGWLARWARDPLIE
ncbi:hypothetical protein [Streptomyces griseorubiginosus]|uniref:hypothetical protein n=1 Tax=Streptomyces griseorubiginosus TaxID=67304 RepID=UPI003451697A